MTSHTTHRVGTATIEDQTKAAMTAWMSLQRPMFSMMTEINGRLLDQALRVNGVWMTFVGRQIEQEIDASRRLMSCRTVQDFLVTYQDVLQKAQREAQIELKNLTQINQEFAGQAVEAVRAGLNEAAQELRH